MDAMEIGARIEKLRRKSGMTQQALAEKLGVTDKAVSKWENGSGYPDITDYITSSRAALDLTDLFERKGFFLLRGKIALPTGKAGDFFWEIPATRLLCLWNDLCPQ